MALWDVVKKGAHKISEGAVKVSDEIQRREELKRKKTMILRRFTLRQLQYMARNYGIKVESFDFFLDDEKTKLTFDDYVKSIRSDLSYEEIISYAMKRKIDVSDMLEEDRRSDNDSLNQNFENNINFETAQPQSDHMHSVLRNIDETFYRDLKFADELDFENHLFSHLMSVYGNNGWSVDRQVKCGDFKDKVDIVLQNQDTTMAMELKIGHNKTHIRNSFGQLCTYSKHFPNTALVVLDVGKIEPSYYQDFSHDLSNMGVELLVLNGNLRNKKNKVKKATIKFS